MKAFFIKLSQFLQDDTGQLSAMRLLFIGWGIGTLGVWLWLSIHTAALAPLPWSITGFMSSLVAGKVVQSYTENSPAGTASITNTNGEDVAPITPSAVPTVPSPVSVPAPTPVVSPTVLVPGQVP